LSSNDPVHQGGNVLLGVRSFIEEEQSRLNDQFIPLAATKTSGGSVGQPPDRQRILRRVADKINIEFPGIEFFYSIINSSLTRKKE
jgi:hypothetical protein